MRCTNPVHKTNVVIHGELHKSQRFNRVNCLRHSMVLLLSVGKCVLPDRDQGVHADEGTVAVPTNISNN